MKKILFYIGISMFLFTILTSCSKQNKAINEYCDCVNKAVNDSLISSESLDSVKKNCFETIIKTKYELTNDDKFVSEFESKKMIKDLLETINNKISKNIKSILSKNKWQSNTEGNSIFWQRRVLTFDGKMFTQTIYRIFNIFTGSWNEYKKYTGTYTIEKDENGLIYITLIYDGSDEDDGIYQKETCKMVKDNKNGYYLDGKRAYFLIK